LTATVTTPVIYDMCAKFDIASILDGYDTDRQRIITALEYFDEKGWIELKPLSCFEFTS